jgi:hypothetical protein
MRTEPPIPVEDRPLHSCTAPPLPVLAVPPITATLPPTPLDAPLLMSHPPPCEV